MQVYKIIFEKLKEQTQLLKVKYKPKDLKG